MRARETRNSLVDTLGLGSQLEKKNLEVGRCECAALMLQIKEIKTALRMKEKECGEQGVWERPVAFFCGLEDILPPSYSKTHTLILACTTSVYVYPSIYIFSPPYYNDCSGVA